MKTKSLVLLAMAVGCGLVAMLGVQQILSGEKPKDTIPVLVAKQEIEAGQRINPKQVAFEDWPRENVPQGAVTDMAQFEDRAVKFRAYPGDVILQAKLGEKGVYGPSTAIRPGLRVVTVPVNTTSSHSGMIRPGDRVDVLCTYSVRRPGSVEVSRTKTVLEYIEVFAVDRNREGEGTTDTKKETKAENLSVLVTPDQAHVLMLAANKGKLQMALRNSEDKDTANVATIDDRIFDEIQATKGAEHEEPDAKPAASEPPPIVSATPVSAEPSEEVWAIEIFEGETKRLEIIKLPPPKGRATAPQVTEPAAQPPSGQPAAVEAA